VRLPRLTKTQKKIAIGAGAGAGLLALTYFALRPSGAKAEPLAIAAKTLRAQWQPPKSRVAAQGQRVIAWPKDYDKNGLAFVKFMDGSTVNAGWVDEALVLRDSEVSSEVAPARQTRALSGLGAVTVARVAQPQQTSIAISANPNAVMIKTAFLYAHPEDPKKIAAAQDFLLKLFQGRFVLLSENDFRFWVDHDGIARARQLIWGFTPDEIKTNLAKLAGQSYCQTIAASVTGPSSLFLFYRDQNPTCMQISAKDDPEGWWQCFLGVYKGAVDALVDRASVSNALANLNLGPGAPSFGASGSASGMYAMEGSPEQIDELARFAAAFLEYARREKPSEGIKIPSRSDFPEGAIGDGLYKTTLATIGMTISRKFIEIFESHDAKVNPCIRELNFDTIFSMFMNTIGVVFSIATAGVTSALGAAWEIAKAIEAVTKLAALSK